MLIWCYRRWFEADGVERAWKGVEPEAGALNASVSQHLEAHFICKPKDDEVDESSAVGAGGYRSRPTYRSLG